MKRKARPVGARPNYFLADLRRFRRDVADVDPSESVFDNCELLGTFFQQNNLEKVDFRTARNFTIDPEQNRMKKAKFSVLGLPGLLGKYELGLE